MEGNVLSGKQLLAPGLVETVIIIIIMIMMLNERMNGETFTHCV